MSWLVRVFGDRHLVRKLSSVPPLLVAFALVARAQTFSSGSTGVDGALDLSNGDLTVLLPDSGLLNYTTVNIPANRTLTFSSNLRNTAVTLLAQGAVTIAGTINLDASGQAPGPGGFYGGSTGFPGFGPGGGAAGRDTNNIQDGNGKPGLWIGPFSLVPNIGGSGAGANSSGYGNSVCYSFEGGGGGGAITIASSQSINIVQGGLIDTKGTQNPCGSSGADGAVRLVSNLINVSGGITGAVVRLEAPLSALTYTGGGTPPVRSTINPLIVPANPPSISISSVGSYPVPSYSGSSFTTIDVLLPNQLQDPIPIVVQAKNIPIGSPVSITFGGSIGATSTSASLTGTMAASTATMYISGLTRSAVSYIFVSSTFDPALVAGNLRQSGPNEVARIEVAYTLGERSTYRFLRRDGTEVSLPKVPAELRQALGL